MNERILWERFKKTGRVEDYLLYLMYKNEEDNYGNETLGQVK